MVESTFAPGIVLRLLFLIFLTFVPITTSAEEVSFQDLLERSLESLDLDGPMNQWSERARVSALIPTIVLDGSGQNDNASGSREKSNFFRNEKGDLLHEWTQAQIDKDQDAKYELSIRLQWNFRQLVFHPDELASEGRAAKRRQQKLVFIETLSASFAHFNVLEKAHRKGLNQPEDEAKRLGYIYYFDGLTNGWFSRKRKGKR